jgi:hypothetical protein
MAITYVGAGAVAGANPVAVPTGYAAGDLFILFVSGAGSKTTPSGWTLATTVAATSYVFTKIATASESAVTLNTFQAAGSAVIVAYRGVTGAYQVNATMTVGTATTSPNANSITTTVPNERIIWLYATTTPAATLTANASTTSRVNSAPTASKYGLLIADVAQASVGAITQRPATASVSRTWAVGALGLVPKSSDFFLMF